LNLPYIQSALNGHKQVFERKIPLPAGGFRHSLATYIPDVVNGVAKGFFVHVADVTYIKELEKILSKARRDTLKQIIETREKERVQLAHQLRDGVNQTLAYCKMVLEGAHASTLDKIQIDQISQHIYMAIRDLNAMSSNLNPAGIEILGFIPGTQSFIDMQTTGEKKSITFSCNPEIEILPVADKMSVFRIVQDFLLIVGNSTGKVSIHIQYHKPKVVMKLIINNSEIKLAKNCEEYRDIEHRLEYYEGSIRPLHSAVSTGLLIHITTG